MKNIFKLFLMSFVFTLTAIACTDDADRDWTTQEASFKLHDTSLGANTLYATMEKNPFILTWDASTEVSAPYTIVVSATEEFTSKVELGKSDKTSFATTVGVLNTAMLQAGANPYKAQTMYVRIEGNGGFSNAIKFDVTPYPANGPVITAPTAGTAFVLEAEKASDLATTVIWNDYAEYGVKVVYSIEAAPKGTQDFKSFGTVDNLKSFEITQVKLNDMAISLGLLPNQVSEIDLKVTATTETTGVIVKESAPVTIKVTPFESDVTLYLIGDATAGNWDNIAGNINMYPLLGNKNAPTQFSYTGYFKVGGFKMVKEKGNWDDQYGFDSEGKLSTSGGSGNISVETAGYYKLSIDVAKMTYTLEPITAPTSSYATVGIIGDATPNGWDGSTAMTKSTFDSNVWYLETTLGAGEVKFRADNAWAVNWGSDNGYFGTATQDGPNIRVEAGDYIIYFNDSTGAYTLIKK